MLDGGGGGPAGGTNASPARLFGRRRGGQTSAGPVGYEGCVHRKSIHHAAGWARNPARLAEKVTVEAVIDTPEGERVLAEAVAGGYYGYLYAQSFDDVWRGFELIFESPLSAAELDRLIIRPRGAATPLDFGPPPEPALDPVEDDRLPAIEGYIDELSLDQVSGWMINRRDTSGTAAFEVVLALPDAQKIIARGTADQPYAALQTSHFKGANGGFAVQFAAPLTVAERDSLIVRSVEYGTILARAAGIHGAVDELSTGHAAGWLRDRFHPERQLELEAVVMTPDGGRRVASGMADRFHEGLAFAMPQDGMHGFLLEFSPPLTPAERDGLILRFADGTILPRATGVHGFVDELTTGHAAGWVRDRFRPEQKLAIEAAVVTPDGERPIASGLAELFHEGLAANEPADALHGFRLDFSSPLTPAERDSLVLRVPGHDTLLPRAFELHGFVDDLTAHEAFGWVRNRFRPEQKLAVEAVLATPAGERRIAAGIADLFHEGLAAGLPDDGFHGFRLPFDPPLTDTQRGGVIIRTEDGQFTLPSAAVATP
jgi:hypothetical protein